MSGSDSPTFFHGQPWSSWIERIGRDKPLSDEEPEGEPSSSVTRLSSDDIDLYGFCPERDTFYGVVCEICNAIVKPQALIQHMESRHPSGTVNLPPPSTPVVRATVKTPYCKVSKLKKAQSVPQLPASGKINSSSSSVKRTAEQANLQPPLPLSSSPRSPLESISVQTPNTTSTVVGSSPVKSPGTSSQQQPRRKRLKTDRSLLKDREYDPDRHCGVWNDETGKPCTRSLTCKAHTVSLRRTVLGRSKTFDKLLAEHRAAKELPSRSTKVTVTGTVTVTSSTSSTSSSTNPLITNTSITTTNAESEAPSSPPVLSLPDTYPLPKAVDLLYRCLAPHGSAKPTKLEEDFANEELHLESTLATAAAAAASASTAATTAASTTSGVPGVAKREASVSSSSMMTPISVVLPSLSPLPATTNPEGSSSSPVATLIPATVSPGLPIAPVPLPNSQPVVAATTVLEGETPMDIDNENLGMYSPVSMYKDVKSSQIVVQIPRANNNNNNTSSGSGSGSSNNNNLIQSPIPRSCQAQASMPSLNMFDSAVNHQLEQQCNNSLINGKRITSHTSPISRQTSNAKRTNGKPDFRQVDIQVEHTTTSAAYPHFSDISWSNCHPEPLAVSRWLRITSNRKQYNFNIH